MYHVLGGGLCEPAHGTQGGQGDRGQNQDEVEIVDVPPHRGACVLLATLWLCVRRVQGHPNHTQEGTRSQTREGTCKRRQAVRGDRGRGVAGPGPRDLSKPSRELVLPGTVPTGVSESRRVGATSVYLAHPINRLPIIDSPFRDKMHQNESPVALFPKAEQRPPPSPPPQRRPRQDVPGAPLQPPPPPHPGAATLPSCWSAPSSSP